jgi:hypothetical protein
MIAAHGLIRLKLLIYLLSTCLEVLETIMRDRIEDGAAVHELSEASSRCALESQLTHPCGRSRGRRSPVALSL